MARRFKSFKCFGIDEDCMCGIRVFHWRRGCTLAFIARAFHTSKEKLYSKKRWSRFSRVLLQSKHLGSVVNPQPMILSFVGHLLRRTVWAKICYISICFDSKIRGRGKLRNLLMQPNELQLSIQNLVDLPFPSWTFTQE